MVHNLFRTIFLSFWTIAISRKTLERAVASKFASQIALGKIGSTRVMHRCQMSGKIFLKVNMSQKL